MHTCNLSMCVYIYIYIYIYTQILIHTYNELNNTRNQFHSKVASLATQIQEPQYYVRYYNTVDACAQ